MKLTVTSLLFQPAPFGGGTAEAVIEGGVFSILSVIDVEAVFPARSTAVPLITWLAPSAVTVTAGGQEATPEVLSEQVKVTTTFVLFQLKEFGLGEAEATMTGGSLSTPRIVMARLAPGLLRSSTAIWLVIAKVTGLSIEVTFWLKSSGPRT
jgi:hypothetical protein